MQQKMVVVFLKGSLLYKVKNPHRFADRYGSIGNYIKRGMTGETAFLCSLDNFSDLIRSNPGNNYFLMNKGSLGLNV